MSEVTSHKTSCKIIRMTEDDLPEIMLIEKAYFPAPWTEQAFRDELVCPFSYPYVAKVRDIHPSPVLGYICFWIILDELHLLNLAVHPTHRRQGIGQELLSFALKMGKTAGTKFATLEVRPSNVAAITLYKDAGFIPVGRRPGYYSDSHEDASIMEYDFLKKVPDTKDMS
ncbi:MAG: ribosomal-protein-alanine N-acetyltransferase [Deltaproteobacteria bacterium]|nr:MAG: ribosomal-protein-alanine N-acetyltransferase [Deltaproteobacteria bacterium]